MVPPAEPKPRFLLTVRKWDVVDTLRREHSLQSIVLFLTPSTGRDMHGRPELARFMTATTLTYTSDAQRARLGNTSPLPSISSVTQWCRLHRPVAEIVFIDCWHSYDDSVQAMDLALAMLPNGGFIVMHDCDPPDLEAAGPPVDGIWCGQTWRAFVDVTASLPQGSDWFVVESDFGVGVIQVPPAARQQWWRRRKRVAPRKQQAPSGYEAGWNWLVEHRTEVLRPMSIAAWQQHANGVVDPPNHYNP